MDILGFVKGKPCKLFMAVVVQACGSYKYFLYFFREKNPKVANEESNLGYQSYIDAKNQCYFPVLISPISPSEKPLSKAIEAFCMFSIICIRNYLYLNIKLNPEGYIAPIEKFKNGFSRLSESIFLIIANKSNSSLSFTLGMAGMHKSLIWFSSG